MTEGDEKYKLGKLEAGVEAVQGDVAEIKTTQKEIIHKLDNISAVSVERWEKRNKHVDAMFSEDRARIADLEEARRLYLSSPWYKVRAFIDSSMVKIVGGALVSLLIVAVLYYVQKTAEYGDLIRDVQVGTSKKQ